MRIRTAKKLAQRIDLNYFKRARGLRRWRFMLSVAVPALGVLWLAGMAAAGSRTPYSSGPVSKAHAFVEAKCEACHVPDGSFRSHVSNAACLTCHDGPAHAANQTPPPDCATCHREHKGRVMLAAIGDDFCVGCHGDLKTTGDLAAPTPVSTGRPAAISPHVTRFPGGHPEFAAARAGSADPGTLRFNHEVHLRNDLRGPSGPETLECTGCHKREIARTSSPRKTASGLMASISYEQQCARCHPLFFDERIDAPAPHETPDVVSAFVHQSLREYITTHPADISKPDPPSRRVPLNFARPPEPPARTADEWVERKTVRAEELLWRRACGYCHVVSAPAAGAAAAGPRQARLLPQIARVELTHVWMPRAAFDHSPHLMLECSSCHAAEKSRATSDVLMPPAATCAACHAPDKGAESRCFECHAYHDQTKAHAVMPKFKITDFP